MTDIEIDFSYANLPRAQVIEWVRLPSGRIVAIAELSPGYPESFWFEPDGTSPMGSYLVPWPLPKNSVKICKVCSAVQGQDCMEVFGIGDGIELGCSACVGVTHFPFTKDGIAWGRLDDSNPPHGGYEVPRAADELSRLGRSQKE